MTVRIARCTGCHSGWHPWPRRCPACGAAVTAEDLPGAGTVRSWTRIERPPSGFEVPQRVVLVALHATDATDTVAFACAETDEVLETGRQVQVDAAEDGRLHARVA